MTLVDSQDQLPERAEPEKDRYRAMGPGEEDHSFEPEAKLKPVIDWSGEFPASMLVAKDPYGNGAGKSQGSWVRQFVLNLAEKDLNPNSDICLVLPVSSEL